MGNRADYKRAWGKQREAAKKARRAYEDRLADLEGYKGSERGDQLIQEARDQYEASLAAARATFSNEISPVLESMSAKAREAREQVTPPTSEQLAILQAVSYIGDKGLTRKDFNRYMAMCASSDVAANSLCNMARTRIEDGGRVEAPQSDGTRVTRILEELRLSAKALASWDGTTREQGLAQYMADYHSGDQARRMSADPGAGMAGKIDPTSGDFEKQVVGLVYDPALMEVID